MSDISYLLIGTTTADIVDDGRILGGTVSYAAPIVSLFGHDVRILTSTASSEPLIQPLYDVADIHLVPSQHTTTFQNIYSDAGRQQIIHHTATNLMADMLPEKWRTSKLVHLAPLTDDVDYDFANLFPDSTVLVTPQGYMRQWGEDGVVQFKRFLEKDVLGAIDILVLSKQDILAAPELEYEFPKYTKHVIVTDGENGGSYYHNGETVHYDAFPAKETDPTGAGDVFAASLLASLPLLEYDMLASLKVAARLAAIAVTVKGATIPFTKDTVQQVLKEAQDKK